MQIVENSFSWTLPPPTSHSPTGEEPLSWEMGGESGEEARGSSAECGRGPGPCNGLC